MKLCVDLEIEARNFERLVGLSRVKVGNVSPTETSSGTTNFLIRI